MARLLLALPNEERFVGILNSKRSIIARALFARSIWNYYAAVVQNSISVTFNQRRTCRGLMFFIVGARWLSPPANFPPTRRVCRFASLGGGSYHPLSSETLRVWAFADFIRRRRAPL